MATALMAGGPGAIFWMWVSAFFGMMTNYAENYLGIRYRYRDENGAWVGGAMVYMDRGLHCKWMAVIFSICCLGASFGMGNMVQGNSMAKGLEEAFHIPAFLTGVVTMLATAYVLNGGLKRVAAFTEKLVPVMAAAYLLGALVVLWVHREMIPDAFGIIFREAFRVKAAVGGAAGYGISRALQMGVARGIFSNEAGLGSSVIAHAQSDVKDPKTQGMWGIAEIFIDTILKILTAPPSPEWLFPQPYPMANNFWQPPRSSLPLQPLWDGPALVSAQPLISVKRRGQPHTGSAISCSHCRGVCFPRASYGSCPIP